jgi:hypothetical protein
MTTPTSARRRVIRAGLACAVLPAAGAAVAQQAAWPARPLRMIIGFAPGGPGAAGVVGGEFDWAGSLFCGDDRQ